MISHHLPNALILDGSVTVQELCTRPLDTSPNICSIPDRIQFVCPIQLFLWTFTGGAFHSRAEICGSNLQLGNPSKLMMCQKACPRRTILSAQR